MDHVLVNSSEEIPFDNQAPNPSVNECQEASNSWSSLAKGLLKVMLSDGVRLD